MLKHVVNRNAPNFLQEVIYWKRHIGKDRHHVNGPSHQSRRYLSP
jgi:hypothetical protein